MSAVGTLVELKADDSTGIEAKRRSNIIYDIQDSSIRCHDQDGKENTKSLQKMNPKFITAR